MKVRPTPRHLTRDLLGDAIRTIDLPALVYEHYPESQAKAGLPGLCFASWRGNKNTPAFSIYRGHGGKWRWKDQASGEQGDALDFLVGILGMERQEAAQMVLQRARMDVKAPPSSSEGSTLRPVEAEALRRLQPPIPQGEQRSQVRIKAMAGRGFTPNLLASYNITPHPQYPDDALIPITSPDGVVMAVKRRLAKSNRTGEKYRYETPGHGAPAWCSPGSRDRQTLLIIEGELNAIIAHAALVKAGHEEEVGVMGVAGANNDPYPGLSQGKRVIIYTDADEAGREARNRWADICREEGARSVHLIPEFDLDFCDYAGRYDLTSLATLLEGMRAGATQVYGPEDRLLGRTSVREIMANADRYFSGDIIHPTGFTQLDRDTGGIRTSGIYAILALSQMGKSSVMRRVLLEQVRAGGRVRLYSPDQSLESVFRLLTSVLTGVGSREVRMNNIHPEAALVWGGADRAKKAYIDTFRYLIYEWADKFQVYSESKMENIYDDMEQGIDQGITMFGFDYLQMFKATDVNARDGIVAEELEERAHALSVPAIVCLQAAKYKFHRDRKLGVPMVSDIDGSGSYARSAEMILGVYNEMIYRKRYGGEDYFGLNDHEYEGRLYVLKDKEGSAEGNYKMRWVSRLAAYGSIDMTTLAQERQGLL